VIEDGLDFEHNVADAELIGSPQVRLELDRKIKYSVPSPLDRASTSRTVRQRRARSVQSDL
jgi:hypothetical protein